MRFIDPQFLFALVFVVIPILIHFFHFKRYKTVYFSQVGFLKAIKQESKKKNNVKQLLILLARIFAIIFLVLAFSQPYLPVNKTEKKRARQLVGIYLDNSFSMKKSSGNGTLLDLAKNKIIDIANSYGPGTNFILITNQPAISQQLILNKEQLISNVSKIKESPISLPLSAATGRLKNLLSKTNHKTEKGIYLLSDFQQYTSDFGKMEEDSSQQLVLVPFASQISNNLMIDTCWLETPGRRQRQPENLHVRIRNRSDQTYQNIPIRFLLNDSLKAINTITIEPNETTEFTLNYQNNKNGIHRGKVELDDYPIVFDNSFYISYNVERKTAVLAIYKPEQDEIRLMEKLFNEDENITFSTMEEKKIQLSQLNEHQCVFILNMEELSGGLITALTNFVKQGGTLAVFPGESANLSSYNQLYRELNAGSIVAKDTSRRKMSDINYQHPLFKEVFLHEKEKIELPYLNQSYRFQTTPTSLETKIISKNDGSPAIAEYPFGAGRLYNFSFSLNPEVTDFYKQAIFVPVLYNIALNSYEPQTIQYSLNEAPVIELRKNNNYRTGQFVTIQKKTDKTESQLAILNDRADYFRIDPSAFTDEAGFYELLTDNTIFKTLAFNYTRDESLSDFYSIDDLNELTQDWKNKPEVIDSNLPDFEERIKEENNGTELWKYFICIGLLFLFVEIAIIRLWK